MTEADDSLRLRRLKAEALRVTKAEGTTPGQFIDVAVAEKLAALRTVDYLRERAARADSAEAEALLDSFGNDDPPQEGDELTAPEPSGTTASRCG